MWGGRSRPVMCAGCSPATRQLLTQRRRQVDRAATRGGLRVDDVQRPGCQVDVLPAERKPLTDSQSGSREHTENDTADARLAVVGLCGVEQERQLLRLNPRPSRPCRLQPAALPAGRVLREQPILDRRLKHLRQVQQRVVDRVVREAAFLDRLAAGAGLLELLRSRALPVL